MSTRGWKVCDSIKVGHSISCEAKRLEVFTARPGREWLGTKPGPCLVCHVNQLRLTPFPFLPSACSINICWAHSMCPGNKRSKSRHGPWLHGTRLLTAYWKAALNHIISGHHVKFKPTSEASTIRWESKRETSKFKLRVDYRGCVNIQGWWIFLYF